MAMPNAPGAQMSGRLRCVQASDVYTHAERGSHCAHAYPAQIVCMHTPNYRTAVSQGLHRGASTVHLLLMQSQLSLFLDLLGMVFNKVLAH